MTVAFLDLAATHVEIEDDLRRAFDEGLRANMFIRGDGVDRFEAAFAAYCEAKHCVGLGNGLDALHLALKALGVGPGDEVVVPAHTFIASWLAVSYLGAVPVPVEPDPGTCGIDPQRVAAAITPRTKAVMVVHLYGHPADLDPVIAVADKHGLPVVEDAAQAHGARYKGRRIGGRGRVACWSFYPGKNLGALGDGGAVTTDDAELARTIRMLGNYGSERKYVHDLKGFNSRLDDVQARLLSAKLPHMDRWNRRRAEVAARYADGLAGLELEMLRPANWAEPVWHLFPIFTAARDALQAHLAARGIQTQIHYPTPPHRQGAYQDMGLPEGTLPITERLHREELSLPMGPHLSDEDVDTVIQAVRDFFGATGRG